LRFEDAKTEKWWLAMAITLTENAATQIRTQLAKRGKGLGLRVGVKDVGCSGFGYTFDYADEVRDSDRLFEAHDAKVVISADHLSFLDGARLDFVKEGFKQVFKIDNPNVDSTCGCGESFNLKETAKS
jgi:iron-sulfur cluster assembly protein